MKTLSISPITNTARFPFKKGTLQFLQDAHKETVANLIIGLIGSTYNPFTAYVIYGCENSGSGLSYNITDGYIFYLGELYQVSATSFTASSGQVAVLSITTTQYTTNADPVTFTDATTHNVHNIRAITIASGVSGSGLADYSDVNFIGIVVADEKTRALSAEAVLQGEINTINSGWTSYTPTISFTASGAATITTNRSKFKVIGKTLIVDLQVAVTITINANDISFSLPSGKVHASYLSESIENIVDATNSLLIPVGVILNNGGTVINFNNSGNNFNNGDWGFSRTFIMEIQ